MTPENRVVTRLLNDLPGLIAHIGRSGFENHLLRIFREAIRADHIAIFLVGPDHQLVDWRVVDTDKPRETVGITRDFIERVWPRDHRLFDGGTRAGMESHLVSRRTATDIGDAEYRDLCYKRPGVIDRLMMTAKDSCRTLHLCAYRRKSSDYFSDGDLDAAAVLAPIALAASLRHLGSSRGRAPLLDLFDSTDETLLSNRERQVANMVAEGATSRDIATELGISSHTVLTYRKRIYEKLGVGSQRELLASRYQRAS